jgi:hypothetical protein
MEIQHVTEAHLEQERIAITKSQRCEQLMDILFDQTTELLFLIVEKAKTVQEIKETSKSSSSRQEIVKALDDNHAEALLQFDRTFLNQLDHKVKDSNL